ncbi:MAG: CotH kinase family protein, partial [Ignavibacteriaceae bacterium]|nr:CotH kinase family protein [Ignavibacteriaceae bacterium]
NKINDTVYNFNGKVGIELRGQSSQQFPKKPYGFEVRDVNDNDSNASILGMPAESDWILYPPYSDKTLMRNVLAYKLSNDLGRYATRTKYCEVILNNEYIGVYVMMEKIKRNKGRVNIKKLEAADTTGDALTGGYIFKIDKQDNGQDEGWTSKYKAPDNGSDINYLYVYPKQENIVDKQKVYIKGIMDKFENVMNSSAYNNPLNGYYDQIDLDTFVDTYIMDEFCKNVDAYRLSVYLYKDKDSQDGRLKYGPIWDFDLSMGNCNYDNAFSTSGWEVQYNNYSDWHTPFWNRKLMSDPVFYNRFIKRWNQVKNTVFNLITISTFLDSVITNTSEARVRNFTKWDIIGQYVWPNQVWDDTTYEAEVQNLKSWISDRYTWLNNNIPASYSDITWLTPDLTSINFGTGNKVIISAKAFYSNTLKVDSVTFVSSSDTLKLQSTGDSLSLSASGTGKFVIKGVAWHCNQMVSVSPAYSITTNVTGVDKGETLPSEFKLFQNYPNPFNPSTVISYQLPRSSHITLKIIDMLGREIETLVNKDLPAGRYSTTWVASHLPSGIYFCSLKAGNYIAVKKILLIK